MHQVCRWTLSFSIAALFAFSGTALVQAQDKAKPTPKPEFPPLEKITEGFTEVKVVQDGSGVTAQPFFQIWKNTKNGQMLAQLPKDYASSKTRHFIAPTISGGEEYAGLQSDAFYVYWKKYGKKIALVQENLAIKGSDEQSKSSVKRLFTDKVLLSLPILTMSKGGGPVIDLDALLVGNAKIFFGSGVSPQSTLLTIKKAKVFPSNIEIAFEVPMSNGLLKTLHYSISKIQGTASYKPRKADQRIGYFTTSYDDYGKYTDDDTAVRYVNRWNLEKYRPELKLSPPKRPIVFYIEHTTPIQYRRWVRKGILSWNEAFENIGIDGAIEVHQQDLSTKQYTDLDPEDVRYNFVRWLNNNISTAIGPSRVNPLTGEILDADIILTDGWIRTFQDQFSDLMPKIAMDGMTPETLAWFAKHPDWDPRVRLAEPSQRDFVRQSLAHLASQQVGQKQLALKTRLMGDEPMDGITGRQSQVSGACMAAEGRGFDVALMRMSVAMMLANQKDDDKESDEKDAEDKEKADEDDKDKEQMLDGMPESFIGPLLADLVAHEVGHTLGLRHNFKASSVYSIAELNSEKIKGKKPFAGSVMDYLPTNFKVENGEIQGDWAMIGVGPYDMWAIEYGYTFDDKALPKILSRVAEPELAFCSDEDTYGPDPLAKRYDFGKNPLNFANDQVALAKIHREKIMEKFVKDGEAWEKARQGYLLTLGLQTKSTSMMANWLGGTFINRDKKGDPNGRAPLVVVPAEDQRKALKFVIEHTFSDESYGLTSELLTHMTGDHFADFFTQITNEHAWPVHDRIMGIQASTLSQLMNPTVLRRVYDNEFRIPDEKDALTLNELLTTLNDAIWIELVKTPQGKFTERKPAITSLRRNLQSEHLQRLMDLGVQKRNGAAMKPIANLAAKSIRDLKKLLEKSADNENFDVYTQAHLQDALVRVNKWLDAQYVVSAE
ncbi:MAG: zinc-dependent metalloprotease [Mariniblastus sp.]|nr:zinc-dependent metalloprotease [Mariniblastus sp.]